jgi:hypothetical protein
MTKIKLGAQQVFFPASFKVPLSKIPKNISMKIIHTYKILNTSMLKVNRSAHLTVKYLRTFAGLGVK